jgi:hypothetical protein
MRKQRKERCRTGNRSSLRLHLEQSQQSGRPNTMLSFDKLCLETWAQKRYFIAIPSAALSSQTIRPLRTHPVRELHTAGTGQSPPGIMACVAGELLPAYRQHNVGANHVVW